MCDTPFPMTLLHFERFGRIAYSRMIQTLQYSTRLSGESCNYMIGSNERFRLCRDVGVFSSETYPSGHYPASAATL
ncbi:uncharacterized protein H6S33_011224 [Morchella sextelata]|uniref:uncharacterized protein n=1 Tax=Morchella sextelata TaxID=1174677 RepID=UPI001D0536F9|nr:uncharacterized protein H6S33_011224 [Morchella sextelata]KAH0610797.1 hypothetical protein H6S33_011224 [Morchella sextelata]